MHLDDNLSCFPGSLFSIGTTPRRIRGSLTPRDDELLLPETFPFVGVLVSTSVSLLGFLFLLAFSFTTRFVRTLVVQ